MKVSATWLNLIIITLLSSCGSNDNDTNTDARTDPDSLSVISGYGRTSSLSDMVDITPEVNGTVERFMFDEGDSICCGDTLFIIRHDELPAAINSLRYDIRSAQKNLKITQNALSTAIITFKAREKNYHRLKESGRRGSISRQSQDDAQLQYQQSSGKVQELDLEIQRQEDNIESLRNKLMQEEIRLSKHFYTTSDSGIILDLDIKRNMPLRALNAIGRYRTHGPYSIDAEMDELYAGNIRQGQKGSAVPYGRTDTIAWGTIVRVSPVLSDKSIFSGNAGGFMDRRVRAFELRIDSVSRPVLIGQRVNVFIKLR